MTSSLKAILELVPLALFVIAYNLYGMTMAVKVMIICTLCTIAFLYFKKQKISNYMIFGYASVLIFGGLTVYTEDAFFIKIKPTVMNTLFSSFLAYDYFIRKKDLLLTKLLPFLKTVPAKSVKFTYMLWIVYFTSCAILNEIVWRNFSEETWIYFKAFGIGGLNMSFMLLNFMVLRKFLGAQNNDSYFRTKK